MFCPRCAKKNPDTNKFCNGCGTSLRVEVFTSNEKTLVIPTISFAIPSPPPLPPASRPSLPEPEDANRRFELDRSSTPIREPARGEDLSKVFEETEARLDELFPEPVPSLAIQPDDTEILDAPRFSYRGMHMDVARHFMKVDVVKKFIDIISRYKFNYFHWHSLTIRAGG